MKVQDIIREETYDSYINRLTKDLKIPHLGSGEFAKVFAHPTHPNVAVKVFIDDDPYLNYLNLAKKYKKNKWFPKIIAIKKVKFFSEKDDDVKRSSHSGYIVFMEKLSPITKKQFADLSAKFFNIIPEEKRLLFIPKYSKDLSDIGYFFWKGIMKYSKDKEITELAKVLNAFKAIDVHSGNIMKRPNGEFVFTDPVSY
jgi:hypothetical protein